MISSNDNMRHHLLDEFFFWQKKVHHERRFPISLFRAKFSLWDKLISNFIWFYKFESSFR